MCITKEERLSKQIRYSNPNHVIQRFHERKHLFGDKRINDMLKESRMCIMDDMRCVMVQDSRSNGNKSNYIAIFITDYGSMAAIPAFIDDKFITILTIKDVINDEKNPNWYIQNYNQIGGNRGINPFPLYYRHSK